MAEWLDTDPSLAPLGLLTNEAAADLPAAVDRFGDRLRAGPAAGTLNQDLVSLPYVLCGLRYPDAQIARLFMSLENILELSTTDQGILNRGRAKGTVGGERHVLLIQGRKRFGPPPEREAELAAITDRARLGRLAGRVLDATGWDDLLATP